MTWSRLDIRRAGQRDRHQGALLELPDTDQAGNAIDFLVKIRYVTFNEAMTMLTSGPMDHNGNR